MTQQCHWPDGFNPPNQRCLDASTCQLFMPNTINHPTLTINMSTSIAASADEARLPDILRLSPATRRRIYWHAGLGPGHQCYGDIAAVCYNLDGGNGRTAHSAGHSLDFHGLLLSCRIIHDEAVALLYSTNHFIIRYQPRQSFSSLRDLTPPALAHLTTLRIVLNQAACHERGDGYERRGSCCMARRWPMAGPPPAISSCEHEWHIKSKAHDLPLDQADGLAVQKLLQEWHSALASLALHITPGTLNLALVCDLPPDDDGVKAAHLLLANLRILPRLKDCHLRLCATRHPRLEALAHEAALQARGILTRLETSNTAPSLSTTRPGYSRLLLLPAEIRLRILEYTDLITPWKEVYWSRGSRGYWVLMVPCMPLEGRGDCSPEHHHGCRLIQCSEPEYPECSIGCFCRRVHAASSSTCRCWEIPTPLFLVCRTLYHDASVAFYTGNRFVVLDSPQAHNPLDWWPEGAYPHATFAVSEFLRTVVPLRWLPYIRFLELVWSPFCRADWPQAEHPALREWAETVDWMRGRLNLPGLTLRLALPTSAGWGHEEEYREMTQVAGDAVLAGYQRIVEPLALLGASREDGAGLARFYAEIACPWLWTRRVRSRKERLKERTERFIMGARYESVCTGLGVPAESVWRYSCQRHC